MQPPRLLAGRCEKVRQVDCVGLLLRYRAGGKLISAGGSRNRTAVLTNGPSVNPMLSAGMYLKARFLQLAVVIIFAWSGIFSIRPRSCNITTNGPSNLKPALVHRLLKSTTPSHLGEHRPWLGQRFLSHILTPEARRTAVSPDNLVTAPPLAAHPCGSSRY